MTRHIFFRDFTLCKAGLLAALMGLAVFSGSDTDRFAASAIQDQAEQDKAKVLPAVLGADEKSGCKSCLGTDI